MIVNNNIEERLGKNNKIKVINLIILSSILTPSIKIASLPAFRIEQIIVILFALLMFSKLTLGKTIKVSFNAFPFMYLGFSNLIILSILLGSFKGIRVRLNDFFEMYKIFIYLGIYLITISSVKTKQEKVKIIRFMVFCILISILISIQQYFNLFHLNEKYVHIIAPTQYRTLVNDYPYPRVIGMTSNPNVYAVMPGIGAILSWSMYIVTKERKNLIYMAIFIVGTLMTLSRSGFAFMVIGILTFTYLYVLKSSISIYKGKINLIKLRFLLISFIILVVFGVIIFNYLPDELTWRLIRGIDIKSDNSFQARIRNWKEHIDVFKLNPLFGVGPAKSIEFEHHTDNEWLFLLRRYGVIGCFYIILTFILPFIKSKDRFFKFVYFSILMGSALYMIPAAIYNSFQLMPLIMVLAGLVEDNKIAGNVNNL